MKPTHLSLFSGIGGLDLAAEMAGFSTVGQCEWADFPTKVLEKHWPDVPRWRDIHDLTGEDFRTRTGLRTVDVISGGFPCQPFSVAGKQAGKEDERYLFPEMLRIISELKPNYVVGENVPGILQIAAEDVIKGLEHEGYRCVVFDYEAASAGAPHRRERVFFVAERSISDDAGTGLQGFDRIDKPEQEGLPRQGFSSTEIAARGQTWGGTTEPELVRMVHGIPDRMDRIKALGNAVVPAQAYPIFKAIAEVLM